jgi:hypothetical protein
MKFCRFESLFAISNFFLSKIAARITFQKLEENVTFSKIKWMIIYEQNEIFFIVSSIFVNFSLNFFDYIFFLNLKIRNPLKTPQNKKGSWKKKLKFLKYSNGMEGRGPVVLTWLQSGRIWMAKVKKQILRGRTWTTGTVKNDRISYVDSPKIFFFWFLRFFQIFYNTFWTETEPKILSRKICGNLLACKIAGTKNQTKKIILPVVCFF